MLPIPYVPVTYWLLLYSVLFPVEMTHFSKHCYAQGVPPLSSEWFDQECPEEPVKDLSPDTVIIRYGAKGEFIRQQGGKDPPPVEYPQVEFVIHDPPTIRRFICKIEWQRIAC